ncbi:MAG TPA: 4Fe-4S binding protein [Candidatus Cloacimonadota bacterium]|nr:4Fe-4S binding protein [Candidatus Cloacimonadota bacterium]
MKRQIIEIDEKKCTGCGVCVPGCPEGALQIIDGKARLVSDLFCDGLGACLGECPEGAITTIEREAEPYDESKVMENIIKAGANTIKAHLKHLRDHDQTEYFDQAVAILMMRGIPVPALESSACPSGGCPSAQTKVIDRKPALEANENVSIQSQLKTWPVQLHLINPNAPYFDNANVLICADCVPFAYANFHNKFVKNHVVITLCPKLDSNIDSYIEKLADIFKNKNIKSLTVARMEVPCCGGTEMIVQKALEKAQKFMMAKVTVVSISGEIL